jgi:hypothetical protein
MSFSAVGDHPWQPGCELESQYIISEVSQLSWSVTSPEEVLKTTTSFGHAFARLNEFSRQVEPSA